MEVPKLASALSLMNYLVLDLETANGDCASICQLGIVTVENGIVVGAATHFVDPEADFDPWNIRVHGIGPERVRGQPTWPNSSANGSAALGPHCGHARALRPCRNLAGL